MNALLSLTLSGAVSGAVIGLLAVGLVLSYSTSRLFNFGYGATAFATAVVYLQLNSGIGWPVAPALLVSVFVFAPVFGWAWERLVFRRMAGADEMVKLVGGIGVLLVMPALVLGIFELLGRIFPRLGLLNLADVYAVPGIGPTPPASWHLMNGVVITSDQVIVFGVSGLILASTGALLRFTRLGLLTRTTVDNPALARLRGTNTAMVSRFSWLLSFAVAGLAGVVAAPFGAQFGVQPDNYTLALFVAATAAIVARLRSIWVAFVAALLIGALRNLAEVYLSPAYIGAVGRAIQDVAGLAQSLPYWILLVALVVMSRDRRRQASTPSTANVLPDYLADLPAWRRYLPWGIASAALLLYGLVFADGLWRQIIIAGCATAVIMLSFTVVTGLGGMISFAQGAFATISGLLVGVLTYHGWPFWLAVPLGVLLAGFLGLLTAFPALRLGGLPFALATLAVALLCSSVIFENPTLTNSLQGWTLSPRLPGGMDFFNHNRPLVAVMFLVALAIAWFVGNLRKSATGRAIVAVRSSEPAAAASGVSPAITKLVLFTLAALIAGLGGALLAMTYGFIGPSSFPLDTALLWFATAIVFGVARPASAVLAGLMSTIFPRIVNSGIHIGSFGWNGTSSTVIPTILFGLAAVGVAKNPHGFIAASSESRYRRRLRKRALAAQAAEREEERRESGQTVAAVPRVALAGEAPVPAGNDAGRERRLLEVSAARAGYGLAEVLHGVEMTLDRGDVLAVIGPNGAGKSTLCAALSGSIPLTGGEIRFAGVDVTALSPERRAAAGMTLIPESRGIFPGVSVEDNLAVWLPDRHDRESALERFPLLAARRKVLAGNLSGGEQQMLSVAGFLIRPPVLLICDEPTLGLAPQAVSSLIAALDDLQAAGTTLVLVEEKTQEVLRIATMVSLLIRGELRWKRACGLVDADELALEYVS